MRNDLSTFFRHYLKALRFAERYDAPIPSGDKDALREMCRGFLDDARSLIEDEPGMDLARAGHDFYLTHNGHGAGFWDGDWPEHGDRLTELASQYPCIEAVDDEQGHYLYVPSSVTA